MVTRVYRLEGTRQKFQINKWKKTLEKCNNEKKDWVILSNTIKIHPITFCLNAWPFGPEHGLLRLRHPPSGACWWTSERSSGWQHQVWLERGQDWIKKINPKRTFQDVYQITLGFGTASNPQWNGVVVLAQVQDNPLKWIYLSKKLIMIMITSKNDFLMSNNRINAF